MGKSPWDEDSDVPAFARPKSGSTRWGRVFGGVAFVVVATFVGAYYLPLFRAHDTLSAEHRRVSEQSQALQRSLSEAQTELKTAKARLEELELEQRQREASKSGQSSEIEAARSDVKAKLDKFLKKGVEVGGRDGRLVVAVPDSMLFAAGKLEVGGGGKQLLCDFAKASGKKPITVLAVDGSDSVPAAFSAKYPSVLNLRAARATAIAETLASKCEVDPGAIRIELGLAPPAATLDGAKVAPLRVELAIGSKPAS